jgi:hypothetical protein
MKNELSLPSNYIPYRKLTICSNVLVNGKVPVLISGNIPFLVGKGSKPKVWINMLPQQESNESKSIVRENLSLHPQVEVVEKNNIVKVTVDNKTLIEVKKISNDEAVISKLDLRMIGIAIYGDSKSLKVGGNSMSKNTFTNVNCMIGMD